MNHNLFQRFRERLPADLSKPFIETDSGQVYPYREVEQRSAQFANALAASGVRPDDRVLVQVDKSPAALFLYLGCLRAGAVYVPLNTAYTLAEVDYFMTDAEPQVVVCQPERLAEISASNARPSGTEVLTLSRDGAGGTLIEKAGGQPTTFSDSERAAADLAAMLYTSGTTGRSKGAMLSHDNLTANAATLVEAWRFSPDDVLLHALPIFHTHGLFVASHCVLLSGSSMLLLPRFEVEQILQRLPRSTVMMGVPTFYTRLLNQPAFNADCCRTMRLFISGSAPLSAETHREFRDRSGHAILERYGMTETGMLTSNPYDGKRRPGSVGPALPGVSVRVCDPESGAKLDPEAIGMIEVAGRNVCQGYWRMPDKTAQEFRQDGFFITGDLGYIDEQGYLTIVGRGKDLIISGGFNVYPKEVESILETFPEVAETAVIGLAHADFGEAVTAVVVKRPDADLTEAAIIERLTDRLAKYKVPKRVLFVDALPYNAMGKVQKNALRERYASLYQAS